MATREIKESDATDFLALSKRLDEETRFMLLEPGERVTPEEQQRQRIRAVLAQENQTILLVEEGGKPVGFVAGLGGPYRRNRHCAQIVIGILQEFAGQGLGELLLGDLEKWARARTIRRLELTVMAHNVRAIALYRKMGFVQEGTKRYSLIVDGTPVDELYMAKMLDA